MKNFLIVLASILFIGVQSGRCVSGKHVSMVIVTRLSAGRNANVEKGLVALNQYILGPRHLPAVLTVPLGTDAKTLGPFFVFKRADTIGVFWDQYGAAVSRSDPPGHGHYVFENSGYLLWKDASLIVRRNNDSLLIYGAKNSIAVRISSTPGDREQDILPTLFKLCPLLQNHAWNGSAGAGRIYFYRGRETVGSTAPIGVSLNGIMIGYFLGGNSYFYIDVPAGDYEIGSRIDYHTGFQDADSIRLGSSGVLGLHAVGFNHAMAFSLAAGQTKFIRLRVHFGLGHPKVKVSAANERSASSIIKYPQGPEINSGPTEQLGALQGPKTNQSISAPIAPAASLEAEVKRIDAASTFYEPKGYRFACIVATREADENAIIGILNGGDYFKATATDWRRLSAEEVRKLPKDIKKDLRMIPVTSLVWLVDVDSLRDPAFDTQYPSLLNNARRALFGTLPGSVIITYYPSHTPPDEVKTNGNLDPSKLAYASLNYSLRSSAQRPSFTTFPATVASAQKESK
ncbi:MAG TPA: DUF2846 domain-containing protein [Bryobacteraceae bacterium]|nr:DUF2846 domain-containing protein [Bryobacteraceae bacterium]HLI84000.1 DUF2846 domain-containing protein [Bryobacteraceae bacterium]